LFILAAGLSVLEFANEPPRPQGLNLTHNFLKKIKKPQINAIVHCSLLTAHCSLGGHDIHPIDIMK
jgi:hypothetical protein